MACEDPEKKKFKPSVISDHVYSPEFQKSFGEHWREFKFLEAPNISLISAPFRLCKISNFIGSESFMEELKTELSQVKSRRQSIDLYQFEQTGDLANVESPNLRCLYETFQSDLASWMAENTDIELNRNISMSSSCYYDTDYLLCHDDDMGDRRIAFVLYLSKNWTPEDGGSLDLFDTDDDGLPRSIIKSLVPEYNSLVFFEVVDNSYHQVAEVTSSEKSRWTINGWFHGTPLLTERPPRPKFELTFLKPEETSLSLDSWISDSYLVPKIVKQIHKDVEFQSYAFLPRFLKPEMYQSLSEDVTSEAITWKRVGPADIRNYEVAEEESLPKALRDFYSIFKSLTVFKLLKDYTELDLVPNESASMDPKLTIELQRWSRGCYTLIYDRPADYDNSNEENDTSPSPTSTSNEASSHASSRSQKDCRSRQASLSSGDNEDGEQEEILRRILREKSRNEEKKLEARLQQQASCSKLETSSSSGSKRRRPVNPDSEDSDVSDIGDYLSDPLDSSLQCSEAEEEAEEEAVVQPEEPSVPEPGTLDVLLHFHTNKAPENETIDYVDSREPDGALIHVPYADNHLCLVYKNFGTSRVHKYVNHYCKGYFYNLICTYYEQ